MTPPGIAAARFGAACLLGLGLGLWYSFLTPLRRRHHPPADLLFLSAVLGCWLYLTFASCRGDLRPVYTLGLLFGWMAFHLTIGKLLRPFFTTFWKFLAIPPKKILKISKILFASGEKWVTIRWSNRRHCRH